MSTRSMIALKTGENACLAIYCHFDGYVAHHGPILMSAYDTEEKVRALLALGDLASLGPELGERHSRHDHSQHPDWCFAFGRDANEDDVGARHRGIDQLADGTTDADYAYLFVPATVTWLVTRDGRIFMPLANHPDLPKPAPATA